MYRRPQRGEKMQPVLPDFGIFGIDFDSLEERINRNAQSRQMAHRAGKILIIFQRRRNRALGIFEGREQGFFRRFG